MTIHYTDEQRQELLNTLLNLNDDSYRTDIIDAIDGLKEALTVEQLERLKRNADFVERNCKTDTTFHNELTELLEMIGESESFNSNINSFLNEPLQLIPELIDLRQLLSEIEKSQEIDTEAGEKAGTIGKECAKLKRNAGLLNADGCYFLLNGFDEISHESVWLESVQNAAKKILQPLHKTTANRQVLSSLRARFEGLQVNKLQVTSHLFHYSGNASEIIEHQQVVDECRANGGYPSPLSGLYPYRNLNRSYFTFSDNDLAEWASIAEQAGRAVGLWACESGIAEETVKTSDVYARWLFVLFDLAWFKHPGFRLLAEKNTFQRDSGGVPKLTKLLFPVHGESAEEARIRNKRGREMEALMLETNGFHATLDDLVQASLYAIDILSVQQQAQQQPAPPVITQQPASPVIVQDDATSHMAELSNVLTGFKILEANGSKVSGILFHVTGTPMEYPDRLHGKVLS